MTEGSNKSLLIGIGVVLGLLLATTLYLFFENRELNEVIQTKQNDAPSLDQDPIKSIENTTTENASTTDDTLEDESSTEASSAEQVLWQATKKINSFDGYLEYIKSADDDGTHNQESISKLLELGTLGWLYSGRTNGDGTYSDDQMAEVIWRKDYDKNLRRVLPKKGDIVSLTSKEARRTYPDFLPRDQQNGLWQLNSNAFVLDVRIEGKSAVILKVVYQ